MIAKIGRVSSITYLPSSFLAPVLLLLLSTTTLPAQSGAALRNGEPALAEQVPPLGSYPWLQSDDGTVDNWESQDNRSAPDTRRNGVTTARSGSVRATEGPYHLIREIPLGGTAQTWWDYLSLDTLARRLYVTANDRIVVIDIDSNKVVGEMTDTTGVHGFALATELGRGFSSNGGEGTSTIVDLQTLKTIAKVPTGRNADAILYESTRQEVYAFNGMSSSATIFKATSGTVLATLSLPGEPESSQTENAKVFVNIPDKNEVAVIDTRNHRIAAEWQTIPGETPFSMGVDPLHHRLFVGCHNRMLVVMDSTNGRVLSHAPIGPRVDSVVFDPGTKLVFAATGDAMATIFRQDHPDRLTVVQQLATKLFSRTMALDLKTHNIYLAAAKFDVPGATWETVMPSSKLIPGTFRVLVYGMGAADETLK